MIALVPIGGQYVHEPVVIEIHQFKIRGSPRGMMFHHGHGRAELAIALIVKNINSLTGSNKPAKMPMIAMTTSISVKVNAATALPSEGRKRGFIPSEQD